MDATTVDVAQLVESRVVIPVVVGSSPIVHPNPHLSAREALQFLVAIESISGDTISDVIGIVE